jgi:hypothetical protein
VDTNPGLDDFRTEFHPSSKKASVTVSFEQYGQEQPFAYHHHPDQQPWAPFRTRLDFEIADLILEAALSEGQTTKLISLLKRCAESPGEFTLQSHADITKTWEEASSKCVDVSVFFSSYPAWYS